MNYAEAALDQRRPGHGDAEMGAESSRRTSARSLARYVRSFYGKATGE